MVAYNCGMSSSGVSEILKEIEDLLALAGDLPAKSELAVEKLLNVVEALSSDRQSLVDEVQRFRGPAISRSSDLFQYL